MSALIFFLSLRVHVATFLPEPTVAMSEAWPLHVAIFGPFILMVLFLKMYEGSEPTPVGPRRPVRNSQLEAVQLCPWGGKVLVIVFSIYAAINFALFFGRSAVHGSPEVENGAYVLRQKSRMVRTITEEEYRVRRAQEVRGLSGHWLIFSLVPLVYFALVEPRQRERHAEDTGLTTSR